MSAEARNRISGPKRVMGSNPVHTCSEARPQPVLEEGPMDTHAGLPSQGNGFYNWPEGFSM